MHLVFFCRNVLGNLSNSHYEDRIDNEMYFGSLPRTMLTLFNVCLIDGWSTVVWPQMLFNPLMVVPMMVFLCVTCFGLMNALIGVIVERTTAAHQNMNTIQEEVLRESKMRMVAQLLDIIDSSDEDDSGTINLEEFRQVQHQRYAEEIFAALNLPPGFDAADLFGLLDADGNGVLDRYEFLIGICRLIWCDEFQSQCLLNYGMAKVRQDLRNLHKDVREVLEVHRGSGQAPGFQDRNKPDQEMADMHKSIAESLQAACQDIMQKHMEQYCQRVQRHSSQKDLASPSRQGKATDNEHTDDEVSLLDYCMIAETMQPARVSRPGGEGLSWPTSSSLKREAPCRTVEDASASVHGCSDVLLQLPHAATEALESHLDELTMRTAARRITLNAAGHLFVEGAQASEQGVKQIVQEILQGPEEKALLNTPRPVTAVKKRRRRRRHHDQAEESPPSPPPAPPSPVAGEALEVRVFVEMPDEARGHAPGTRADSRQEIGES